MERHMKRTGVGSRELKTRLGAYLRQVQNGHVIVVTERGRPVAELRPIGVEGCGEETELDKLVVLGILSRKSAAPLRRLKPLSMKGKPLSAAILEGREDRV
jgi:prevent-host-death family protein